MGDTDRALGGTAIKPVGQIYIIRLFFFICHIYHMGGTGIKTGRSYINYMRDLHGMKMIDQFHDPGGLGQNRMGGFQIHAL